MFLERLCLWLARTNAWIVAPGGPEGGIVLGLDDGQRVSGGGATFTSLHPPGHTWGSVCLRLEVEGEAPVLFSGDHLFAGSVGRTDLPGGSSEALLASMADKILPLDDDLAVLPGHVPTTTIGRERATNPFLVGLSGAPARSARELPTLGRATG